MFSGLNNLLGGFKYSREKGKKGDLFYIQWIRGIRISKDAYIMGREARLGIYCKLKGRYYKALTKAVSIPAAFNKAGESIREAFTRYDLKPRRIKHYL